MNFKNTYENYLEFQWLTLVFLLIFSLLFIGCLFLYKNRLQTKEKDQLVTKREKASSRKQSMINNQIINPLVSLLRRSLVEIQNFDKYKSEKTISMIKEDIENELLKIINNPNYQFIKDIDETKDLYYLVEDLRNVSPMVWEKKYKKEIFEVINAK